MAVSAKGEVKKCAACLEEKPTSAFSFDRRTATGLAAYCRPCKAAKGVGYYQRWTPEQREKHKRRVVKSRYGLTSDEYESLISSECGICGAKSSSRGRLCIDHDHQAGHVRGVLCTECNLAVGYMHDDPCLALRMADYLLRGDDL